MIGCSKLGWTRRNWTEWCDNEWLAVTHSVRSPHSFASSQLNLEYKCAKSSANMCKPWIHIWMCANVWNYTCWQIPTMHWPGTLSQFTASFQKHLHLRTLFRLFLPEMDNCLNGWRGHEYQVCELVYASTRQVITLHMGQMLMNLPQKTWQNRVFKRHNFLNLYW